MSEFCHQINFDGTELFARPDTLSKRVRTLFVEPFWQLKDGLVRQANQSHKDEERIEASTGTSDP